MKLYDINGNPFSAWKAPATVVVAASNSNDEDKAIADYVCDGANDELEIQAALNNFISKSGTVILCDGQYYIDSLYDSVYCSAISTSIPDLVPCIGKTL